MNLLPDSAKYDLACQLQACQSKSRRNGKVARLPLAIRDEINRMLDDGLPYKIIIAKVGEPGKHLNKDSISNWRLGGYQDYLKAQALNDRARFQTEAAADAVRDMDQVDPARLQRACQEVALLQYFQTLMHHGQQLSQDSLKKNPAKLITLMNTLCNTSHAALAFEKQKSKNENLQSNLFEPNRTPKK